jgi:hypothetical protein
VVRLPPLQFLLVEGVSVRGVADCSFLGLHTILFILGGVVMGFGVSSFGFHTESFFGVAMILGMLFCICLDFFCVGISLGGFPIFDWISLVLASS